MNQFELQTFRQRFLMWVLAFSLVLGLGTISQSSEIFAEETMNPVTVTETKNDLTDETPRDDPPKNEEDTSVRSATLNEDLSLVKEEITIIHTNDMHGRLQGDSRTIDTAQLKAYIDEQQPTLVLDGGDAFQGLPISNIHQGKDMAQVMNEIGYDAMAVGNHEFDFGLDVALSYKEQLKFPILSANTFINDQLAFDPYTIVDKAGIKFGIIGLTTPETSTKTHPKNIVGVTFKDPIPIAIDNVQSLKDQVDQFIFVGHLGVDPTTPLQWRSDELARQLSEKFPTNSMLIVDGHSHTPIEHGQQYGRVKVVQAGSHLDHVGLVKGRFENGELIYDAELLGLDVFKDYPKDEKVSQIVEAAAQSFEEATSEVVVDHNEFYLDGQRENVRTKETNLGNLVADTLFIYGKDGFSHRTDFSMVNGGGIRESVQPGPITKGDLIKVNPFGNVITQITLTGEQIYAMFEHALRAEIEKNEDGQNVIDENGNLQLTANGGFLQISRSIKVYFDANKPGAVPEEEKAGHRVLQVQIYDQSSQKFLPVDLKRTYYMATNDFLAAGGDGYTMLGGEREEGPSLDQVVIDVLKGMQNMNIVDDPLYAISLSQYKDVFPNQRVIQMTEAAFNEMQQSDEVVLDPEQSQTDEIISNNHSNSGQLGEVDSAIENLEIEKPNKVMPSPTEKNLNQAIVLTNQVNQTKPASALPQTGDDSQLVLVGLLAILVGIGTYGYQRKRHAN